MVLFSVKLRDLRKKKNMTQKMLADRLGLATSAICSYEAGTRYPSYETLIKIAGIFKVSTDYLLGTDSRKYIDITDLSEKNTEIVISLVEALGEKNKLRV